MGSKYTKRYTEDFKRDAVALVDSSGKTVTPVARELGISSESLRGWYRRAKADRGEGAPGELTTAEREELKRSRRQNAEQARTIEVLRKAAVFFAILSARLTRRSSRTTLPDSDGVLRALADRADTQRPGLGVPEDPAARPGRHRHGDVHRQLRRHLRGHRRLHCDDQHSGVVLASLQLPVRRRQRRPGGYS
ncbi:transposase-like protein [Streptomyces sp. 3330]|nr:transposase-like protein [Streptomyces sp. 3330]